MTQDTAWGTAHRARAPLIGRDNELAAMDEALTAVERQSQTRIVSIIGPPGIGKTRLIQDFLQKKRAQGSTVASRVSRGSGRDVVGVYGIFGRLLRARFGLVEGMDKDAAKTQVRTQVAQIMADRKVGDVLFFLGQFLGLPFEESPLTRAVRDDPAQAEIVRRAVLKAFLEADASRAPLCLIFEDLHAAHDDSLALLHYLLAYLSGPILILNAARPDLIARHEDWAKASEGRHTRLELGPLSSTEIAQVAEALLAPCMTEKDAKPPIELITAACSFAGGNPQLIEQMVRIYHEKGVLEEDSSDLSDEPHWLVHLDKLSTARLPVTVEDAVSVRLAALDAESKLLLEQAAAIGNVFWTGALVVVGRAGAEAPELWNDGETNDLGQITKTLQALVDKGYLQKAADSSFARWDEYVFQHSKERELLIKRVSSATLRRYYEATADWLEQQDTLRSSEEHLRMLASYREKVGDVVRAGLAFLDAGDVSRRRYSNVQAADYYERGLRLLGESHIVRRIDALHDYGDVLYLAGRIEDALSAFREMLTLAYRIDNRRKGGAAHNRIGRLHRDVGTLDEAAKHLGTALRLFELSSDERGIASTIDDIGKLHWLKGDYTTALTWFRDALARREQMGDRRSIALSLNNVGLALQDSGEFKQALTAFEQSLALRREVSDLFGVITSLNNLGTIAQDQRDFGRALDLFQQALEVARQVGDRNKIALLLTNIGETYYRRGDPNEAVRILQQAEELCDARGDKLGHAEVLRGLGKAYLLQGDLEKARDSIGRAVDLFAAVRSKVHLGIALRTLGEITAAGGWGSVHTKSARAYFARSVSIFEETGNEVELARTFKVYAKYLVTEKGYSANPATRREASAMNDRAEAIFRRLKISSLHYDDEPTAPHERIRLTSDLPPSGGESN